jgi:hypothetical protein
MISFSTASSLSRFNFYHFGFCNVNRLLAALLREAIDLVDSGVASAEAVDKAFRLSLGLLGPILSPLLRAHLADPGSPKLRSARR